MDIDDVLARPSHRQRMEHDVSRELLHVIEAPTAREKELHKRFRSKGETLPLREYCQYASREECR